MSAVADDGRLGVALIGSGRMGSFHPATLARRIPGARLVAVVDPTPILTTDRRRGFPADGVDERGQLGDVGVGQELPGWCSPARPAGRWRRPAATARAALTIALAAAESARTGRPVRIEDVAK